MKDFVPHQIFGLAADKYESLFFSKEGESGFLPISIAEAKKKNEEGKFGIFRAVNAFNYIVDPDQLKEDNKRTYRYEKNLTRLRACYNDLDLRKEGEEEITDMPNRKAKIRDALFAHPCPPAFIVETKNGMQPWWIIDAEDGDVILDNGSQDSIKIALYKSINEGITEMTGVLAARHGLSVSMDPVKDVSRVLRMPGFLHKKSEPFACKLHLPEKSHAYTLAELSAAFARRATANTTPKEVASPTTMPAANPRIDHINATDIRTVIPLLWPDLRLDKHNHNFVDTHDGHTVAMFVNRDGLNIVHPGGGDRITMASTPFLLVRNELFPISEKKPKRVAAAQTVEWFMEHFDLEPRVPAYPWEVMADLVGDCWYGYVDGHPHVLFRHKNSDGEYRKWQPVPIKEAGFLNASIDAWLHGHGYANLIPATGRELQEDERKGIHPSKEDYRKKASHDVRAYAVLGEVIEQTVRITGNKKRILVGDERGFYEIVPGTVRRKSWGDEKVLMETNCRECAADLSVTFSALNEIVPLLSSFKSRAKGGRFLAAYSVLSMLPFIEIPVFLLLGDPRTAKTSKMRTVTAIADPNDTLEPRTVDSTDPRNLIANLSHNWLITIDNKGNLTHGESDQICTLFSGGINIERTLHTNTGVTKRSLRRPCLISAIEPPKGIKPDLWDRFIALESSLAGMQGLSSDQFDENLTDILPRVRGAAFHLLSRLLELGPIEDPIIIEAGRRKRAWAMYATRLYELMDWDRSELLEMFEECNSFVQQSERQTDATTTCLQHVLSDFLSGEDPFAEFDAIPRIQKKRYIVDEKNRNVKIASHLLIELLKKKSGVLRMHPADIAQISETPEKLSKFMESKNESLVSLGIQTKKYSHKDWRGWEIHLVDPQSDDSSDG